MKLKINYDLIEKIKESKNGIKLNKIVKTRVISFGVSLAILSPLYVNFSVEETMIGISSLVFWNVFFGGLDYLFEKKIKNLKELSATFDLLQLTNALSKLEVRTTTKLLKEAEVISTNYKIKFKDSDKTPVLKQEKYIEVPLSNGYKETLLQEHNIGSKDYELSVQEPAKEMSLKLSKAAQ